MKIGILGTGMVGETIGTKLVELGHEVRMGSRSAANEKAESWVAKMDGRASQGTFADAAAFGNLVFNCTKGSISLEALQMAGHSALAGRILVDLANPLDPNHRGQLLYCNSESLGERIQAAFPDTRVVKTFNTMWCGIMVNPRRLAEPHAVFMCGNDAAAKQDVTELVTTFGWTHEEIVDLGDITAARGTEMVLPLWLRLSGTLKTGTFNFRLVKA